MNDPEPRASEHRYWKLWHHGQVQGHAVTLLKSTEVSQQRRDLVYAHVEFLIRDVLDGFALRFRDEVDRGLVLVPGEMAVDAVIAGIDTAADKPLPEWRRARVERDVPGPVPVEKIGIFLEAVREIVEAEPVENRFVGQVRLGNEFLWRMDVGFFLPVDRDLSFGHFCGSLLRHTLPPTSLRGGKEATTPSEHRITPSYRLPKV